MWDLSPRPGIDPVSPALEGWSLNHWTTGKSLQTSLEGSLLALNCRNLNMRLEDFTFTSSAYQDIPSNNTVTLLREFLLKTFSPGLPWWHSG